MRVMLVASGDLWAGAEVMVRLLACGLTVIPKLELFVVLLNKGRLSEELEKYGINVLVVDESRQTFLALARDVRKLVAEFSPDVVHSHRYKENLLAWFATFGRHNVKLVTTQHGMPEAAWVRQSAAKLLKINIFFRLLSCCFNRTVVVSAEMQRALIGSYGYSVSDVNVIHNGVDILDDVILCSEGRVVVGSAGRLFPVKDFTLFVDIARHVSSQSIEVDFVLAGDGPEKSVLEEKVKKYGLQDNFKFLGHHEDMDAFYKNLDVYINTSVHEGIPMSVLEAMSYGLPVVVPNVGGFPEIVEDGVSGYLIDGRDPESFTGKILDLLQTDLRCLMSEAARQRVVDCFSQEAMVGKYYELYKDLVCS